MRQYQRQRQCWPPLLPTFEDEEDAEEDEARAQAEAGRALDEEWMQFGEALQFADRVRRDAVRAAPAAAEEAAEQTCHSDGCPFPSE